MANNAGDYDMASKISTGSGNGVSFVYVVGMILAGVSSWLLNQSVGWCVVHAMCSWWYMIYLCMGCGGGLPSQIF